MGRVNSIWQHDIFADLKECWVITDALFAALVELSTTLRLCASTSRATFQASYCRLQCVLQEYNDIDRVRCALGITCKNADRHKTSHPGFPTVVYNWACARPRIFPLILFMETGSSLMQTMSAQFVSTSPLWHELRCCIGCRPNVRSFQENWDYDTSVPLREIFPKRMGVCRILHVFECGDTTVAPACNFRVNHEMHLEWMTEESHVWADHSMLPSDADIARLEGGF